VPALVALVALMALRRRSVHRRRRNVRRARDHGTRSAGRIGSRRRQRDAHHFAAGDGMGRRPAIGGQQSIQSHAADRRDAGEGLPAAHLMGAVIALGQIALCRRQALQAAAICAGGGVPGKRSA